MTAAATVIRRKQNLTADRLLKKRHCAIIRHNAFSFFKTDFFQSKLLAAQYLFIPGAAFETDTFVLHDIIKGMAVTAQSFASDADHLQLTAFKDRQIALAFSRFRGDIGKMFNAVVLGGLFRLFHDFVYAD